MPEFLRTVLKYTMYAAAFARKSSRDVKLSTSKSSVSSRL